MKFEKVVLFFVTDLDLHATYRFKIYYPPPSSVPSVPSSSLPLSSSSIINKKYLNHFSLFLLSLSLPLFLLLPPLLSLSTIFQHQNLLSSPLLNLSLSSNEFTHNPSLSFSIFFLHLFSFF